jgi:hypothetical protein
MLIAISAFQTLTHITYKSAKAGPMACVQYLAHYQALTGVNLVS